MNELIKIDYDNERPTVLARDLHELLQVQTAFKDWFPRMCEYGFAEGTDFNPLKIERVQLEGDRSVSREVSDAQITIDMAKEICMIQRNERGKQARQYFISVENQWNSPDAIMQRALQIANARVKKLTADVSALTIANSDLTVENQIMLPKAEYFDALVDRNLLTSIRETAKQLEVKERDFVAFLIEKKFLYRDKKGKLMPYAGREDLFEVKECINERTQWSGTQTMITPKGREAFRMLLVGCGIN